MRARVVAIVQARMASSRLPGKVLMDLEGVPVLGRVVERTRRARTATDVVLATTTEGSDDAIADYCRRNGIAVMRGSHFDVLDRYYRAAKEARAEIVVRITADCPLIDPALVDEVVHVLHGAATTYPKAPGAAVTDFDFVANRLPPPWRRTYPIGLDTEVCTFVALERAWREAREPTDREHVMPYLYQDVEVSEQTPRLSTGTSAPGFRIAVLNHTEDLGGYRWTVDTAEDLEFVRQIYRHMVGRSDFTWQDVLEVIRSHPELAAINAGVKHKTLRDSDQRARRSDSA
jgi:spore coat polysaccharide biosynthesis protein SpsF